MHGHRDIGLFLCPIHEGTMTIQDKIDLILKHVNKHMRNWFITIDNKIDTLQKDIDLIKSKMLEEDLRNELEEG